ncbi:hypothetical protein [Maribacter aestuarii]|uniref:hypothetical protein n=1 Tax=Maribacter aestuarii TaxID=1130723 RepID=UPI0025A596A2|nr:hypothetical protein [Maribacter aestuarii]
MSRIYLNESLKKYYANCLKKEIKLNNIDDGIVEHIISISQSNSVRPTFSKRGKASIKKKLHSYLRVSFTKEMEEKLFTEIMPFFEKYFSINQKSECNCKELLPYIQDMRQTTEHNEGAKWLVDPKYHNISQILFVLNGGDRELHNKFWTELDNRLSIL